MVYSVKECDLDSMRCDAIERRDKVMQQSCASRTQPVSFFYLLAVAGLPAELVFWMDYQSAIIPLWV